MTGRCHCVGSSTNPTWDEDGKTRHRKDRYYGEGVLTGSITQVGFTGFAEVYLSLPIRPLWNWVWHGTWINSFTLCNWAGPKCVFVSRLIWNNNWCNGIRSEERWAVHAFSRLLLWDQLLQHSVTIDKTQFQHFWRHIIQSFTRLLQNTCKMISSFFLNCVTKCNHYVRVNNENFTLIIASVRRQRNNSIHV
jgi:hypothetical protein